MRIKNLVQYYKNLSRNVDLRKYLLLSSFLFLFFLLFGVLYSIQNSANAQKFFDIMADSYLFAADLSFLKLFLFIFKNNSTIALVAILSGFIFGLPTFFILVSNAFIIGLVIQISSLEISTPTILFSIIPHAIFEIPAILFSFSLGFFLGEKFFRYLFKERIFKKHFINILLFFILVVLPLLFLAAMVETMLIFFVK